MPRKVETMRSRKILWGLACLAAATTLFADKAHADRRSGLGGNLLIQDPDDLFPFPQYALQHRNMIRLDYGSVESGNAGGNGVLTLGDEKNAYGIALHRGDLMSPDVVGFNSELAWLGGVQDPFNSFGVAAFPAPALDLAGTPARATLPSTVVDLFYARSLGRDTLGFRLGFGRGIQAQKVDSDVSKGSSTFIAAQVGYSRLPQQGFRLDMSGNVMAAFGKSKVADEDNTKGFDLRVGGLLRGYYPLSSLVDIGVIGNISVDNEHVKRPGLGGNPKSNDFGFGAMAGVGPAIHVERAQVAAYGGFTLGAGKNAPDTDNDDSKVSRLSFAAPMVNIATEVQVLDWLFVRTAAQYTWQLDRFKSTEDVSNDDLKERVSAAPFTWSVGLGAMKNNFYFDGVFRNAFVTNGPQFIGGNNPGFMAMASMTYKFGDVFNTANNFNGAQPGTVIPANERRPEAPAVEQPPVPEPEYVDPAAQENGAIAPAATGDANANANGSTSTGNGGVNTQGSAGGSLSIGR